MLSSPSSHPLFSPPFLSVFFAFPPFFPLPFPPLFPFPIFLFLIVLFIYFLSYADRFSALLPNARATSFQIYKADAHLSERVILGVRVVFF